MNENLKKKPYKDGTDNGCQRVLCGEINQKKLAFSAIYLNVRTVND